MTFSSSSHRPVSGCLEALLQGSPTAQGPTSQLPGQSWARPQQVSHQPEMQSPNSAAP